MKSAYYRCTNTETSKESHYLVVYDEKKPCVLCGLPVVSASASATAICGWCDCGQPRAGTETFRRELDRRLRRENLRITPAEAWGNKTQDFYFDTRAEADAKMYELYQQGIGGFPHVIERMAAKAEQADTLL